MSNKCNSYSANRNLCRNRLVVFSGGSAANSIVDVFNGLLQTGSPSSSYSAPPSSTSTTLATTATISPEHPTGHGHAGSPISPSNTHGPSTSPSSSLRGNGSGNGGRKKVVVVGPEKESRSWNSPPGGGGGGGGGGDGTRGQLQGKLQQLSYIIGISDNGGSTSEILRVFGGPGIGDVRSRLIRLVPDPPSNSFSSSSFDELPPFENEGTVKAAIKNLLNYRLPASETLAKSEWLTIVEGTHPNWTRIPSDKRELLRSFLIHLHSEILKRARPPTSTFNFHSASIGNLFLTSARLFFGSFESAIYLFRSITSVPENIQVVPAINSMFAHHIAAGLADGTVIVGQNEISHPSDTKARGLLPSSENIYSTAPSGAATPITPFGGLAYHNQQHHNHPHGQQRLHPLSSWPIPPLLAGSPSIGGEDSEEEEEEEEEPQDQDDEDEDDNESNDGVEDANLPGSHPSLKSRNIVFEKENEPELPSRIDRIWYINPYGQEIRPPANPKVIAALNEAGAVVFSIGSLYTSIIPCLILRGIGHALSSPYIPFKILILNGSLDRETGPSTGHPQHDFSASDFIQAIVRACIDSQVKSSKLRGASLSPSPSPSPLPHAASGGYSTPQLQYPGGVGAHSGLGLGVATSATSGWGMFIPPTEYMKYVTHVVYLEGKDTPRVDLQELRTWGIKPVKVEGRSSAKKGAFYDVGRLRVALEGIIYG